MLVFFVSLSFSCSFSSVSTSDFGNVLYFTDISGCSSSSFSDYSETVAGFSDSVSVIDNRAFEKFDVLIFEGVMQRLGDGLGNAQRVVFCDSVFNIELLAFNIIDSVRLDYYGSSEPTYEMGTFSSTYRDMDVHVSSNYGSNTFLGLSVTRDLSSPPSIGGGGSNTTTIVIVVVVVIVVAVIAGIGIYCYCRKKNQNNNVEEPDSSVEDIRVERTSTYSNQNAQPNQNEHQQKQYQNNQYDHIKLLLSSGADVNAMTCVLFVNFFNS